MNILGKKLQSVNDMNTEDFDYQLDESLIAQKPLINRSDSRMMVINPNTGQIAHKRFKDLGQFLRPGDLLVLNSTKVLPARLFGNRPGKDEKIEVLLLEKKDLNTWETLVRPGKKMRIGSEIVFGDGKIQGRVVDILEDGSRLITFTYEGLFEECLDELGEMPLPPYIKEKLEDKNRYQTVYAKTEGSAAAPTAGLHFTPQLIENLKESGVEFAELTLHVGLGTFRPVKVSDITKHHMHSEYYALDEENAEKISKAKAEHRRVIAVGTTSTRTLESIAKKYGQIKACSGWTDIFIYPGFEFEVIDGLITNFHLPKSTLMMLVSAFAGKKEIFKAYDIAQKEKYRFFSFGDCMLIEEEKFGDKI